jgi:hypothetical protein
VKNIFLILLLLSLGLGSCRTLGTDLGLVHLTDLQQREGPTGTLAAPAALDPFKRYDLVLAANECRYFQMNLPEGWYWKLFVTAVNRSKDDEGTLKAALLDSIPAWQPVPLCLSKKEFHLKAEGQEEVLGVANTGPTRPAILELCQDGPPLRVTLSSEVSPINGGLMRPLGMKSPNLFQTPAVHSASAGE